MTIDEFQEKQYVTEKDIYALTEDQMNKIANPEPKPYKASQETKLRQSIAMKAAWARKKIASK